ncbi:MAG: SpoIIE family protein phosphatase [Rhodospirillaceae bacterium]
MRRYVGLTLASALLAMSCLWGGAILWIDNKAGAALAHKGMAVAISLQATLEDSLSFGSSLAEMRGVERYLERLQTDNPDIRTITISDAREQTLFSRGDNDATNRPLSGETPGIAILPIHSDQDVIGYVKVVSKQDITTMVLHARGVSMIIVLVSCLALAGLWAGLIMHRQVMGRLRAVHTRLIDGANGCFEEFPCLTGGDEMGFCSQALAFTALHIRERASQFAAYATELREIVAEPTAIEQLDCLVAEIKDSVGGEMLSQNDEQIMPVARITPTTIRWSLRTRVIFLEIVAILLASVAMGLAWRYSEILTVETAATGQTAGLEAAWRRLVAQKISSMATEGRRLAMDRRLIGAIAGGDTAALGRLISPIEASLVMAGLVSDIEIVGVDGNILAGDGMLQGSGTLGTFAITTIVRTGEPITGLGLTADQHPAAIFAYPVLDNNRVVGVTVFIFEAAPLLSQLAALAGSEVFAIDLKDQLIYSRADKLWQTVSPLLETRRQGTVSVQLGSSIYSATTLGIPSFGRGRLGYLLAIRDITAEQARATHIRLAFIGFGLTLFALVVAMVFHYLQNAFSPLDNAISALNRLAQGEVSVIVNAHANTDEVGRISIAIRVFRDRTRALARVAEERLRRRRRQERLIRRQMLTLAETLQNEARDAVLKDLDRIEQEASSQSAGADIAAELDALAIAFQTMACRVQEQHVELDMLVGELREALKSKTAFIALQQELEIARELQLSILPRVEADEEDFSAHALMIPAKEVGGDFYDFFFLSPRRVGIVVADVSGKGVPAALFMAVSRTLLKATATFGLSPGPCLSKLNNLLEGENEKSLFVTTFYGILDLNTGVLTYANGGHNPPMLVGFDGTVAPLAETGGVALALVRDLPYVEQKVTLKTGDTLVLYTDGVTEARNPNNDEFGEDRLVELLTAQGGQSSRAIIDCIIGALHDFASGGPQADDITCLAFHYKRAVAKSERRTTLFENTLSEVPRLLSEVECFANAVGASREVAFNISLGVDEIFTNTVGYGYDDNFRHEIELSLEYDGAAITATLSDDGRPFDPLTLAPPPDLSANIVERSIGGLGIHLVRNLMDDVRYSRDGRRNRIMLVKRLSTETDQTEESAEKQYEPVLE